MPLAEREGDGAAPLGELPAGLESPFPAAPPSPRTSSEGAAKVPQAAGPGPAAGSGSVKPPPAEPTTPPRLRSPRQDEPEAALFASAGKLNEPAGLSRRGKPGGSSRGGHDNPAAEPAPLSASSGTPVTGLIAVATDEGGVGRVKVYDPTLQSLRFTLQPFATSFQGGVRVAVGDVTGDGSVDIVSAQGQGGVNRVKVHSGVDGSEVASFLAYSAAQADGLFVAVADVTGDGVAEIVTGPDSGTGPVKVFNQSGLLYTLNVDMGPGGVRVAAGDVNADGRADVIAAAGPGAAPRVAVYDGANGAELYNYFAYEANFFGGVYVAAGDLTGDGRADVITGPGPGRAPEVRAFHGADTAHLARFLAYDASFQGGVRVAAVTYAADGMADVVTAQGPDGGRARLFDGQTLQQLHQGYPFGQNFDAGLFVAADAPIASGFSLLSSDPTVSVAAYAHPSEAGATGAFRLTHSGGSFGQSPVVNYTISGTAINGTDYTSLSGSITLTWPASHVDVTVYPTDDSIFEGTETIILTLQPGSGYVVGTNTATLFLTDNDAPPTVTLPPPTVPNGSPLSCVTFVAAPPTGGVCTTGCPLPVEVLTDTRSLILQRPDLTATGIGEMIACTAAWASADGYPEEDFLGNGWTLSLGPKVLQGSSGTLVVAACAGDAWYFDPSGGGYEGRYHGQDTLGHDTTNDLLVFTAAGGDVVTFYDFDSSRPTYQRGRLKSWTDPEGNVTALVDHTTDGKPEEMQRASTVGGTTVTESLLYTYIASGSNAGKLENLTLRRKVNSGSWETVRQVDYAYYGSSESHGTLGDLKLVEVQDASGVTLDTTYYRYYTSSSSTGYAGGLKYVFNSASFARLDAAVSDPFTATDAEADDYADAFVEYDSAKRVTKLVAQGEGCSACTGGLGESTFTSGTSGYADGHNSWSKKLVETLPDGNTQTTYTNFAGQVMLSVFKETATGTEWATFNKYDGNGRLVLTANPSAVSGYDDTKPDLLNNQSGNYQHLRDSTGLIETRSYGASTTATTTTAGNVNGYLKEVKLQKGETGTGVLQASQTYIERTAGGATIFPTATSTVYRNADGTGGQTTSYAYAWYSGTVQAESVTVTPPTVTTAQNGPNTADVVTVVNDQYGRPVWSKDGGGVISYTEYDQKTGGVVKVITDVDTDLSSDFTGLPSGWSNPNGLHLKATMEVDHLGRTTKLTDPVGNITYTVYDDDNHEVRVYRGWNTSTNKPTTPTEVYREDRAGSYTEVLTMSATPNLTSSKPNGTEAISSIQTLARSYTNAGGQTTHSDAYFNLSGLTYSTSTTLGTENTHFYRTEYAYINPRGWLNRTETPTGTITRVVHDSLGRVTSTWVGLDDTPTSGSWSPTNTAGTDLVKVSQNVYDAGGIGDSNLTKTTAIPGGSAANRVSEFHYDWRNRLVATKGGVQTTESTDVQRPISYVEYDNLSQTIAVEMYDGDNVAITDSNSDGVPDKPSSSLRRARSEQSFDEQGRAYQSKTFSVDQSNGNLSTNALTSNVWFDKRGQVIKTSQPGGLVTKMTYDGAGRTVKTFATDGGGDSGWSDADDVTGDVVLSQTELQYDANSNVIFVISKDRFHDETTTGELGNPTTAPKARVSYAASYYDKADRLTDSVSVGTNGGSSYTRPGTVPSRSDTVLVVSQSYNDAGWVEITTDPRGIVGKTFYDALGRTTKTVEAYVDGTPSNSDDKTTEFTYNGSGHMLTLKAYLTSSTYQKTEWVYGITTASGSTLNSNDLLKEMKYPDKSTGDPSSSEKESYTVNALGETLTYTDRNGSVHTITFDVLGRPIGDAVTTLGSGVDGTVRRMETAYDTAGRPYLFTSYDAASGGNVVNQVQREFNGLGQLTKEYQSHSGTVNTGTTLKTQYAWSEMTSGANHSRLTSMTYSSGYVRNYNYSSGLNSNISRLSSLSDSTGTLESLDYRGLSDVVRRAHPQPGVDLTFIKQTGESNGDAGDQYTGHDRFGRIEDLRWLKTSTGTHTDRFKYGHDRNSNRLFRENLVDAAFSELYHENGSSNGYDPLNQLKAFKRGTLNSTKDSITGTPSRTQEWAHDALGNFATQTTDGTAQSRTHNKQNQVTGVASATLTFDANGNLKTDETGQQYKYDAWNRLVEVKNAGSTVIAAYQYDATGRRTQGTGGGVTTDLYYSSAWQVLEEREGTLVRARHVWSPVYVNAMVLRDRDVNGDGTLEERLWVQHDANYNVRALYNGSGSVVERFAYDSFGRATVYDSSYGVRTSPNYGWVYGFQGMRADVYTGLVEANRRWFSPSLGRWVNPDPIGLSSGDTNFYRFVGNSPHNKTDPSGLSDYPFIGPDPTISERSSQCKQKWLILEAIREASRRPRMLGRQGVTLPVARIGSRHAQAPPSDLTDDQWAVLQPLIPPAKPGGAPRTVDMREVLNTLFYLTRSGCTGDMLPHDLVARSTASDYFRRWRDDGTWQKLVDALRTKVRVAAGHDPTPSAGAIDSQSVKTTEIGGPRGSDGGKKVNGRKRHIVVDTLGYCWPSRSPRPPGTRAVMPGGCCRSCRRRTTPGWRCWGPTPSTTTRRCRAG